MNTKQTLESQFPLDFKKKFWKKFLGRNLGIFILFIFTAGLFSFVGYLLKGDTNSGVMPGLFWILLLILIVLVTIRIVYDVWYIKTYMKRYYYSADENFITIKKGVFMPTEIHVQYPKIQDVYVDQDFIDRILGIYDVHIASATVSSGIEAHIDGVNQASAEGLKDLLLNSIRGEYVKHSTQAVERSHAEKAVEFSSSEEISNDVYPFNTKWFFITLFTRFFGSLITTSFILFYATGKGLFTDMGTPIILIAVIVFVVFGTVWRVFSFFLWKKNYAFKFEKDFIYFKEGIFSIAEKHMPYSSVQDVILNQSFFGKIFGYSDVIIQNATQTSFVNQNSSNVILVGLESADAQHIAEVVRTTILKKHSNGTNGL